MSETFKRWRNARCVFNGDFYSITSYSGYRSLNLDLLGGNHMLSPDTSDEELGTVVFNALSKSRFIPYESLGDFLDNEKRKERYDQWVTEMMGFHRYRSRRQLFKKMNSCDIRLLDGVITIMPYGHEKLELWTGKGIVESDNVVIPADSSPEEVGTALRLAFSRCRSYV
ncbi:contact-dependent growth inhibition system immunity protein [Photorhabdus namnaonensis]|nr:contact-dependent growth inhibition system immunity protein [Photorhabdus namnaonensis]